MEIIIVGGGIAGLGAAIALRRAGGKVLEQSSLLHETGAAITITPNASKVLQSWAFNPASSGMVPMRKGSLLDGTTMQVFIDNYFQNCEETWGTPMYAVHRVDLHNQLKMLATQEASLGTPVDIRVRSKVVDYDCDAGTVTLQDGTILNADLIVAADGVHSQAVSKVLSNHGSAAVQAGDTGWACMRWLVPTEDLLADPETAPLIQASVQRYFMAAEGAGGLVWYPCRNNEVQNFLYLSQKFDTSHAGEDFRGSVEPNVPLSYAKKHFGPALHAAIGKARDVKFWKLVAREPIPQWHRGRLVVIGDAAHPMLTFQAQGAGQALEDGAALGALLEDVDGGDQKALEERLRLFEQVRRNRGSALQILSNSSPPAPQSVRDAAAKYLPEGKTLESTDDMNEYVFSFDVLREARAVLA